MTQGPHQFWAASAVELAGAALQTVGSVTRVEEPHLLQATLQPLAEEMTLLPTYERPMSDSVGKIGAKTAVGS